MLNIGLIILSDQKFVNILLLWFEKCLGKENSNFSVFKMVWRFIEDHQIGNNFQYKRHLVPFFQYIIYIINFPEKLAFDCVRFEEFICVKDDHFLVCNVKPLRMFLEKSTVLMEYIY